ncbi:J domain-containing protein [Amycolatopsis sp. H20-H5]|uniref:J domain-containing protein n=1 Tax=Amycolatopsis sp. H20-H5 TaxID=3046309 RepID=UPI002DB8C150|nr:DnaJ domain-containing protein [Amycolatopsis sp. H20-H5]MEC3976090.1 DnaJ domain-containing protein [Amycolatopsis sp. H20-H5]
MPVLDFYEVLGVGRTASPSEIKTAYRKLAKTLHPDTGGTVGTFRLLREAYDTLSDPVRRAGYDAGHAAPVLVRTAAKTAPRPRRRFGEEPGFVPGLPDLEPEDLEWWPFAGQDARVRHGRRRGPGHTPVVAAVGGMVLVLLPVLTGVGFSAPVLIVWLLLTAGTALLVHKLARGYLAASRARERFAEEFGGRIVFGAPGTEADELAERLTAELLDEYLTRLPGARIFHGLSWPGSVFADVDHAVLCGKRLVLIESKLWLPGHYETGEDDRLLRNGRAFRGGGSRLAESLAAYRELLPGVALRGAMIIYPSRPGDLSAADEPEAPAPPMTPEQFLHEIGGWLATEPSTVDAAAVRAVRGQVVGAQR